MTGSDKIQLSLVQADDAEEFAKTLAVAYQASLDRGVMPHVDFSHAASGAGFHYAAIVVGLPGGDPDAMVVEPRA